MRYDQMQCIEIGARLSLWGFKVWLSGNDGASHGFYSDLARARVVCFQTTGGVTKFSGNYMPTRGSGTGWQIGDSVPRNVAEAQSLLMTHAPRWANASPIYTDVAYQLDHYQRSSRYHVFGETLAEACAEYRALLNSPANGWGQHVHPLYGQSHNVLRKINAKHGALATEAELKRQFT